MRAQLKHVLLDVDILDHPKFIGLEEECGTIAQLAVIHAYCKMSKATNAVISKSTLRGIARKKGVQDVDNFERYCVTEGLIVEEMGGYSNGPVIKDQEQYAAKLEDDKERKRLAAEKKRLEAEARKKAEGNGEDSDPIPTGIQEETTQNLDIDFDFEDLNKEKNGAPPFSIEIKIPSLNVPDVYEALKLWRDYLPTKNKTLTPMALEALQSEYSGRPDDLVNNIRYTVTNGWKTLCQRPAIVAGASGSGPPKSNRNVEEAKRLAAKYEALEANETFGSGENNGADSNRVRAAVRGDGRKIAYVGDDS